MKNLLGSAPADVLSYGPSKLMINAFLWHEPLAGIIASYTPTGKDVADHFGIFRGVDQIEAFAQASIVSCAGFLESQKQQISMQEVGKRYIPAFISIGNVYFHSYIKAGETFISLANIKFYKFRQMVADGRIYKVPEGTDLSFCLKDFTVQKLLDYSLPEDFILVAELFQVTGRALKMDLIK